MWNGAMTMSEKQTAGFVKECCLADRKYVSSECFMLVSNVYDTYNCYYNYEFAVHIEEVEEVTFQIKMWKSLHMTR